MGVSEQLPKMTHSPPERALQVSMRLGPCPTGLSSLWILTLMPVFAACGKICFRMKLIQ